MARDEINLNTAWEDACIAFRQVAGIDLKSEQPASADEIRKQFDAKKTRDSEVNRRVDKLKTVFDKTLTCVDRVGGIAAQGASMVFGSPASIAGNALSFFINAGIAYQLMYAGIDDVLSQILVVLERFQVYYDSQSVLPPQMILVANKLLVAVVEICGACFKTLKKHRLSKFFTLTFFADDDGVKGHLNRLQTLQAEESQMSGALNLVATQQTKQNIQRGFELTTGQLDHLAVDVRSIQAQIDDKENLKYLREALNVSGRDLNLQEYQRYADLLSSDSCDWLKDDSIYNTWIDVNRQSNVLVLSGDEGCGKSVAATAIISDLNKRHTRHAQNTMPASIAYFYLTQTLAAGQSSIITDVANSLAWQMARNDPSYRQHVAEICKQASPNEDTRNVWQQLFLNYAKEGSSIFLLIDGTHNLAASDQQRLAEIVELVASAPRGLHCKLLISARMQFGKSLAHKHPLVATIKVAEKIEDDMSRFIAGRMKNMQIFRSRDERAQTLLENLRNDLPKSVDGSFIYASILLDNIEMSYDVEEARAVVERAKQGQTLSDTVKSAIEKLNKTLSPKEIEDLNTILLWTMFSATPLTTSQLEAIILYTRGKLPLKPIREQINDRLSDLFILDTNDYDPQYPSVHLRSDAVYDFFSKTSNDEIETSHGPTAREIRMVQNLIRTVCGSDLYDELDFESFFQQKTRRTSSSITVDSHNAHAHIATVCLRSMIDNDRSVKLMDFKDYANSNLLTHLSALASDNIHSVSEADVGILLVQLLFGSTVTRQAIASSIGGRYSFLEWSFRDDMVQEVIRLFKRKSVTQTAMAKEADQIDWMESICRSETPEIAILLPTGQIMAEILLTGLDNDMVEIGNAFIWLFGFFNKQQNMRHGSKHPRISEMMTEVGTCDDEGITSIRELPTSMIHRVFEFGRSLLKSNASDFATARNLATVLSLAGYQDLAVTHFEKCLSLKNDDAPLIASLAQSYGLRAEYGSPEDYEAAIKHARRAIDIDALTSLKSGVDVELSLRYGMIKSMIGWNVALRRFQTARDLHLEQLELKPADDLRARRDYQIETWLLFCREQRYSELVAELKAMASETQSAALLSEIFFDLVYRDKFPAIINAFEQVEDVASLKQCCESVLNNARQAEEEARWGFILSYELLRFHLADLSFRVPADFREAERAIQAWEELAMNGESHRFHNSPGYRSVVRLGSIYIQRAVEAAPHPQRVNDMLDKLKVLGNTEGVSLRLVRSLICRFHLALGDAEKAKTTLQPDIETAIDLLRDDNDENDYQGYFELGCALAVFGDEMNAVAAWRMIGPNQGLDIYKAVKFSGTDTSTAIGPANESGQEDDDALFLVPVSKEDKAMLNFSHNPNKPWTPEQALEGPLSLFQCSGGCYRSWTYADDIWMCETCIDVFLCSTCHAQLGTAEAKKTLCSAAHPFLHIPPWDPASIERTAAKIVLVGNQEIPIAQWLAEIASDWDVAIADSTQTSLSA